MKDIMLDFETFGTQRKSVLRSIGAVSFNPDTGEIAAQGFYANIREEEQLAIGLDKDPSTVKWWLAQDQAAQDALMINQKPLDYVIREFNLWWRTQGGQNVWAQGSNFDPGLWEDATAAIDMGVPWKFWNTRDTRTVYQLAGYNSSNFIPREGTHHNALDDARHQVKCVAHCIRKIKKG